MAKITKQRREPCSAESSGVRKNLSVASAGDLQGKRKRDLRPKSLSRKKQALDNDCKQVAESEEGDVDQAAASESSNDVQAAGCVETGATTSVIGRSSTDTVGDPTLTTIDELQEACDALLEMFERMKQGKRQLGRKRDCEKFTLSPSQTWLLGNRIKAARNKNKPVNYELVSTNKNFKPFKGHADKLAACEGYVIKMLKKALKEKRKIEAGISERTQDEWKQELAKRDMKIAKLETKVLTSRSPEATEESSESEKKSYGGDNSVALRVLQEKVESLEAATRRLQTNSTDLEIQLQKERSRSSKLKNKVSAFENVLHKNESASGGEQYAGSSEASGGDNSVVLHALQGKVESLESCNRQLQTYSTGLEIQLKTEFLRSSELEEKLSTLETTTQKENQVLTEAITSLETKLAASKSNGDDDARMRQDKLIEKSQELAKEQSRLNDEWKTLREKQQDLSKAEREMEQKLKKMRSDIDQQKEMKGILENQAQRQEHERHRLHRQSLLLEQNEKHHGHAVAERERWISNQIAEIEHQKRVYADYASYSQSIEESGWKQSCLQAQRAADAEHAAYKTLRADMEKVSACLAGFREENRVLNMQLRSLDACCGTEQCIDDFVKKRVADVREFNMMPRSERRERIVREVKERDREHASWLKEHFAAFAHTRNSICHDGELHRISHDEFQDICDNIVADLRKLDDMGYV